MQEAIATVKKWLNEIVEVLILLAIVGAFVGVLFDDYFGVIANISAIATKFGDGGLAGLLALILFAHWYKKR
ncbi:MAG: hypothetical protein HQ509_09505 [Candidatus Marinimicrobia bacterium]|nr:hypothetical protein [Candidatus Neomarinimicrobiota bacterium]